ncbi:MAG TPA: thioredoxin family protein [Polyangia bacterium]|nr:thioredoxin family protein [Polyangia bacterium]
MRGALAAAAVAVAVVSHAGVASAKVELGGDISVASFWAPWCKPCMAERPMIAALERALAADGRVRVYELNVDDDASGQLYQKLFGGDGFRVPRLIVVDRDLAGLERLGARAGESSDGFVRDVSAAVSALEAGGTPAPPSRMWRPFHARKRR